jgi:threonine dehydrogenase-like Zn-dependent dehydrogenase
LVPQELRDVAILIEPLTIAEKTLIQIHCIQQRLPWGCPVNIAQASRHYCHRAVVLGAGPVGLLGAMVLVNAGYETYVYSRSHTGEMKAALTESIGARYISSQETTVAQMAAQVGNIDVVYEALGASQLAFEVMQVLGSDGVFVCTGVPKHGDPISLDTDLLMRNMVLKNQVILGTVNAGRDAFEAAIRDLQIFNRRWPQALRALITGRYPIEAFREPIFAKSGIKNIIVMGENR